ncbi:uncharacterized protein [Haliotis cracherodii]|uniref:uncharacterized protein n=1 Tax=Haliotis cracherodii TaxID=6455 RepID=UPI0039E8D3D8
MAGAEPFVDAKLAQRKVLLFSKTYCPDSKTVKKVLEGYKMPPQTYEVVEIEKRQDCNQIENYLLILCLTDSRAVPQLFVNGKYVGGFKEITRFHESGRLKNLLKEAGAM